MIVTVENYGGTPLHRVTQVDQTGGVYWVQSEIAEAMGYPLTADGRCITNLGESLKKDPTECSCVTGLDAAALAKMLNRAGNRTKVALISTTRLHLLRDAFDGKFSESGKKWSKVKAAKLGAILGWINAGMPAPAATGASTGTNTGAASSLNSASASAASVATPPATSATSTTSTQKPAKSGSEPTRDALEAELAEIDAILNADLNEIWEKLKDPTLTVLERGTLLAEGKLIYETLHPETRQGGAPGNKVKGSKGGKAPREARTYQPAFTTTAADGGQNQTPPPPKPGRGGRRPGAGRPPGKAPAAPAVATEPPGEEGGGGEAPNGGQALELVRVDFHGDVLEGVKEGDRVWIALGRACENLGIDGEAQRLRLTDPERQPAWAVGRTFVMKVMLAGQRRSYPVFMLDLRSIPMWLATVQPGRLGDPGAVEKLRVYQLEAHDHLARVFIDKVDPLSGIQDPGLRLAMQAALVADGAKQIAGAAQESAARAEEVAKETARKQAESEAEQARQRAADKAEAARQRAEAEARQAAKEKELEDKIAAAAKSGGGRRIPPTPPGCIDCGELADRLGPDCELVYDSGRAHDVAMHVLLMQLPSEFRKKTCKVEIGADGYAWIFVRKDYRNEVAAKVFELLEGLNNGIRPRVIALWKGTGITGDATKINVQVAYLNRKSDVVWASVARETTKNVRAYVDHAQPRYQTAKANPDGSRRDPRIVWCAFGNPGWPNENEPFQDPTTVQPDLNDLRTSPKRAN